MEVDDVLIPAPQVRKRYGGRSDMWLWRLLRDAKSGFPQPFVINRRRYWRLSDLANWERDHAALRVSGDDPDWPLPALSDALTSTPTASAPCAKEEPRTRALARGSRRF